MKESTLAKLQIRSKQELPNEKLIAESLVDFKKRTQVKIKAAEPTKTAYVKNDKLVQSMFAAKQRDSSNKRSKRN